MINAIDRQWINEKIAKLNCDKLAFEIKSMKRMEESLMKKGISDSAFIERYKFQYERYMLEIVMTFARWADQ